MYWFVKRQRSDCKFCKTCVLTTPLLEHWQQFHSYWVKCYGSLRVYNDHSLFVMKSQKKTSCRVGSEAELSTLVLLNVKPVSARFTHLFSHFLFCLAGSCENHFCPINNPVRAIIDLMDYSSGCQYWSQSQAKICSAPHPATPTPKNNGLIN